MHSHAGIMLLHITGIHVICMISSQQLTALKPLYSEQNSVSIEVQYTWKNTRWLIIIKHKQSAPIKCKNHLFKPCVRSKQPRTIKTIICNDIFTSLRRKKKIRLNSVRNCSVYVRITFDEMESSFPRLTMFVCNFGVGSLGQP